MSQLVPYLNFGLDYDDTFYGNDSNLFYNNSGDDADNNKAIDSDNSKMTMKNATTSGGGIIAKTFSGGGVSSLLFFIDN